MMNLGRMAGLLTVLSCLSQAGSQAFARQPEIVIGAPVSQTGHYARASEEQRRGLQLWMEQINARGGLLGQSVRLLAYDDRSSEEHAARHTEQLVSVDRVPILIGPYSSASTRAAASVAEQHHTPMVSIGASASDLWGKGTRYLFGIYTPGSAWFDPVLDFAQQRRLRRVALVYPSTPFARDVAQGVRRRARALRMRVVFEEEYPADQADFASMVAKMKLRKPDVVLGASYLPDSMAIMQAARDKRLYARLFAFAVGPVQPDFGKKLGLDAEGVMGVSQWEPAPAVAGVTVFVENFKKRFGYVPDYHAAGGYAAGQVIEAAVKKAGSTDRRRLRDALSSLDIMTVFGRYRVDSIGRQTGKTGYVVQWIDGMRMLVLPGSVAARPPVYPFRDWGRR